MVEQIRPNRLGAGQRGAPNKDHERAYEVKSGADTEFAILPGEQPLAFEVLRTKVAEEWMPDGPVEEDVVHTVAKCIWRKQRYQRFREVKSMAAKSDPQSKAYDEVLALQALRQVLDIETQEDEIRRWLQAIGGNFEHHLKTECPRSKFKSVAEWIEAMKMQIDNVLMPAATRFGVPPREVLIEQSAAVLNDEHFARELEYEERIDVTMQRALEQLEKIKAAKRRITLSEALRFSEAHPLRSADFEVKRVCPTPKGANDETR